MKAARWLALIIGIGAVLRIVGIGYGLPATYNADEPHIINVAVSFGAGTLNPHHFKYPTLYMYLLFAAYGVYFLLWSGFGLVHSIGQFGELFVWSPTSFYLLARLISAACSTVALVLVFRAGKALFGERTGLLAAASLAAAPILIESAHAAKPESLMLLLAAVCWYFAARYMTEGGEKKLIQCGFFAGLACSAQYTAAPLAILPLTVWCLRKGTHRSIALALSAIIGGFLIGSPFALFDFPEFWRAIQDMRTVPGMVGGSIATTWLRVVANVIEFSGIWIPGGALFLWGVVELGRRDRRRAWLLLTPIVVFVICLSLSGEGAWQRYLFAAFPGIALVAGRGFDALFPARREKTWQLAIGLAVLILPGAWLSAGFDRRLLLPDTRTIAADWIESNIPVGSKILLDQEHASPRLRISKEMVERLLAKTRETGHPRSHVYELMLRSHPGGGYSIYRILRSAADLHTLAGEAAFSSQGQEFIDLRGGLSAARKERIRFVVLTSFGAEQERSPELARFLSETEKDGRLLKEFDPEPGMRAGPRIRVYRIDG